MSEDDNITIQNQENLLDFLQDTNLSKPNSIKEDNDTTALDDKGGFMSWYYMLGHLSYSKMHLLIRLEKSTLHCVDAAR